MANFDLTVHSLTNNGLIIVSTGDVSGIPAGIVGSFTFTDTNTIPVRTYQNLSITALGKEIKFGTAATTTITGALTINGTALEPITLKSSTDGVQWKIDPLNTRSVSYVKVKDSDNTNAVKIVANNSVNLGNNAGWDFGGGPTPTPTPIRPSPNIIPGGNALYLDGFIPLPMAGLYSGAVLMTPAGPVMAAAPVPVPSLLPVPRPIPIPMPIIKPLFNEATITVDMPTVVPPDTFREVSIYTQLPKPPIFAEVRSSLITAPIVPPNAFTGASFSTQMPIAIPFAGVAVVSAAPTIARPDVFASMDLSAQLPVSPEFRQAAQSIITSTVLKPDSFNGITSRTSLPERADFNGTRGTSAGPAIVRPDTFRAIGSGRRQDE